MNNDLQPRRVRWRALSVVLCVAALVPLGASPASALTGFTGEQDQRWYLSQYQSQCLYTGNNGELYGCTKHTYTFVSSNDDNDAAYSCARIYNRLDHSKFTQTCNYNLARHCRDGYGSGLDCTDQDHTAFHAGARNNSAGSSFLIRGRF